MSGPVVADLGEAGILARITPLLPSGRDVLVGALWAVIGLAAARRAVIRLRRGLRRDPV